MKRIVAVFLVLSLLVVSASAAGVYEIEDDTSVMMSSVSLMSSDYGVATTDLTSEESNYLRLIYDNVLNLSTHVSVRFDVKLSELKTEIVNIYTRLGETNTALTTLNTSLSTLAGKSDTSNYWLENIWSSIGTSNSLLGKVATSAQADVTNSSLYNMYLGLVSIDSGVIALREEVANQFNALVLPTGSLMVGHEGQLLHTSYPFGLEDITQSGFISLRSLIAGSELDNLYEGTITTNENTETSFSLYGIGPILNTYLDAIQLNVAQLAYMFASPADLEAKKESESTTESFTDNFLNPDSDASIKLSDVGVLKDSSKTVQELGQTGVTPGQAFEQLTGNSSIFSFFTQETANDLDTTVSTYSRDPGTQIVTSYYSDSRAEFFDLIGKGGEE